MNDRMNLSTPNPKPNRGGTVTVWEVFRKHDGVEYVTGYWATYTRALTYAKERGYEGPRSYRIPNLVEVPIGEWNCPACGGDGCEICSTGRIDTVSLLRLVHRCWEIYRSAVEFDIRPDITDTDLRRVAIALDALKLPPILDRPKPWHQVGAHDLEELADKIEESRGDGQAWTVEVR